MNEAYQILGVKHRDCQDTWGNCSEMLERSPKIKLIDINV